MRGRNDGSVGHSWVFRASFGQILSFLQASLPARKLNIDPDSQESGRELRGSAMVLTF